MLETKNMQCEKNIAISKIPPHCGRLGGGFEEAAGYII
jgi:hypothetical protein